MSRKLYKLDMISVTSLNVVCDSLTMDFSQLPSGSVSKTFADEIKN